MSAGVVLFLFFVLDCSRERLTHRRMHMSFWLVQSFTNSRNT